MQIKCIIRPNEYHDSVFLMGVARQAGKLPGVQRAALGMGTVMNKGLLKDMELYDEAVEKAAPNDLMIALRVENDEAYAAAQAEIERRLKEKHVARASTGGGAPESRTIAMARAADPGLNLAMISLPGEYAAAEAAKALSQGLNVYMFSDDISYEDERMLKQLSREKNLLMMGPGCGLTFVQQTAVGLASKVLPGPIGLIAASGSGLQETMVQIDLMGSGVSQGIGTGGRDLRDEIGGITTLQSMDILEADPDTKVIVLISKPPGKKTVETVLERVRRCKKPVVVNFIGGSPGAVAAAGAHFAATFEETAARAVSLALGKPYQPRDFSMSDAGAKDLVEREHAGYGSGQRFLRGIFCGGTLAEEAMMIMRATLPEIHSNTAVMPEFALKDARASVAHSVIDIGTEEFTRGLPHAAIDPAPRIERFNAEAADPSVAVILLDFLLGYGCHADPCGMMAEPIADAIAAAKKAGRRLTVVASICGTEHDPQRLSAQKQKLLDAGAIVMPSNAQASRLAGMIASALQPMKNGK